MGIIYDMIQLLDYEVAMEAEDITEEVQDSLDTIKGVDKQNGGGDATAGGTDNSDGNIDTNTDDILGTQSDDDGEENSENPDEEETPEGNNEDVPMDENGGGDDISSQMQQNDSSFEAIQKRKMHQQFVDMFHVIVSDIKLIHEYTPKVTDRNTIRTLSNINANLVQIKEYVYQILTEEFNSLEYPILKKRYVALNHVYDLCIRTLDKYFEHFHEKEKK